MQTAKKRPEALAAFGKLCVKQAIPLAVLLALAPLLWNGLTHIDVAAAADALRNLAAWQWMAAATLTIISYWAMGGYEAAVHQMLRSKTDLSTARAAGIVSIALSQCTGFGIIIGTLARWRMLPDTSLPRALTLTAVISVCFLAGWAVVTGAALAFLPSAIPHGRAIGVAILLTAAALLTVSLFQPRLRWGPYTFAFPSLPISLRLIGLATVDLLAAGLAFWCLLPHGTELSVAVHLPAYLLAFTAGLVGSTPAGLGPFEVTLLALLPAAAASQLIVALVAFRIVYYLIPATVAAIALAFGPKTRSIAERPDLYEPGASLPPVLHAAVATGPRAELGLVRQGTHLILHAISPRRGWLIGETGSCLVGLTDPFGPEAAQTKALEDLCQRARSTGKVPAIYKCTARVAARARALGHRVVHIADEAVIDPTQINLQAPDHRQLRR